MTSPAQVVKPPSFKELVANSGGVGGKYFAFKHPGEVLHGKVVSVQVLQVKDIATKEPVFWANGEPKWQVAIALQTNLTDPEDPDDDGRRAGFFKWWGDQRQALQQALDAAGVEEFVPGGTFTATYTHDAAPTRAGMSPAKQFEFKYVKPSSLPAAPTDPKAQPSGYAAQPPAQQYAPPAQQQAAPAETPVQAAIPAGAPDPADLAAKFMMIKTLLAGGMSHAQIAAATGLPMATVQAVATAPAQ